MFLHPHTHHFSRADFGVRHGAGFCSGAEGCGYVAETGVMVMVERGSEPFFCF